MSKRKMGRVPMDPKLRRSERVSLLFTHSEMREIEAMANQLDLAVVYTLRRIVLLALRRHREDQAKRAKEAAQ